MSFAHYLRRLKSQEFENVGITDGEFRFGHLRAITDQFFRGIDQWCRQCRHFFTSQKKSLWKKGLELCRHCPHNLRIDPVKLKVIIKLSPVAVADFEPPELACQ